MTFKSKREQLGLSLEEASKSLKFGTHLVQAIESEQWDKLGPAIYANSYLNSYIKLLGLNTEILNEIPRLKGAPVLKTITAERIAPSGTLPKKILATITIVGILAMAAFLYSRYQPSQEIAAPDAISMSASIPNNDLAAKNPLTQPAIQVPPTNNQQAPADEAASANMPTDNPVNPGLPGVMQFTVNTSGEAWIEILDAQNAVVLKELIPANQERTQSLQNVGKITVGNAAKTEIRINGVALDLAPFVINDVARFTINADGKAVTFAQ